MMYVVGRISPWEHDVQRVKEELIREIAREAIVEECLRCVLGMTKSPPYFSHRTPRAVAPSQRRAF